MSLSGFWLTGIVPGATAGLVGGLVFGLVMLDTGLLPTVAQLARVDSAVVGFVLHMFVAVIIGRSPMSIHPM